MLDGILFSIGMVAAVASVGFSQLDDGAVPTVLMGLIAAALFVIAPAIL